MCSIYRINLEVPQINLFLKRKKKIATHNMYVLNYVRDKKRGDYMQTDRNIRDFWIKVLSVFTLCLSILVVSFF